MPFRSVQGAASESIVEPQPQFRGAASRTNVVAYGFLQQLGPVRNELESFGYNVVAWIPDGTAEKVYSDVLRNEYQGYSSRIHAQVHSAAMLPFLQLTNKANPGYAYDTFHFVNLFHRYVEYFARCLVTHRAQFALFATLPQTGPDYILYATAKTLGIETICLHQATARRTLYVYDLDDFGRFENVPVDNAGTIDANDLLTAQPCTSYVPGGRRYGVLRAIGDYKKWNFNAFFRCANQNHRSARNRIVPSNGMPRDDERFVWFPLESQPGNTAPGGEYDDPVTAIEHLSIALPDEWLIYVTSSNADTFASRPAAFHMRLASLRNVRVVVAQPSADSKFISRSAFVATVSGSAGCSALSLGKNVLVFGRPWYVGLPGVFEFENVRSVEQLAANQTSLESVHQACCQLARKSRQGVVTEVAYLPQLPSFNPTINAKRVTTLLHELMSLRREPCQVPPQHRSVPAHGDSGGSRRRDLPKRNLVLFGFNAANGDIPAELKSLGDYNVVEWFSQDTIGRFHSKCLDVPYCGSGQPISHSVTTKTLLLYLEAVIRKNKFFTYNLDHFVQLFPRYIESCAQLLKSRSVDCVVFANLPHGGADFILYYVAKALGILTLCLYQSTKDRVFYVYDIDDFGHFAGVPEMDDAPPVETLPKTSRKELPYMAPASVSQDILGRKYSLRRGLKDLRRRRLSAVARYVNYRRFLLRLRECCSEPWSPRDSFVYFPLHLQPELTTTTIGGIYRDQMTALEQLSAWIPQDWSIYVKENPKQGDAMRPDTFFARLKAMSNVRMVPMDTDTHALIEHSQFVATVTGTVGWEAISSGKNALVFGRPWYLTLPGVFSFDDAPTVEDLLRYKIDHSHLSNAYRELLRKTCHSAIVDNLYVAFLKKFDPKANGRRVAELVHKLVGDGPNASARYPIAQTEDKILLKKYPSAA